MNFGVHLPLLAFGDEEFGLDRLLAVTEAAERLGFSAIAANDHLTFSRPWRDGPTALAAVLPRIGRMSVATTVALPVVRTPVLLAKTLTAIDLLSGGRVIVGVGPGSNQDDYKIAGVPWDERWKRLEEVVSALRALMSPGSAPFEGRFYSTRSVEMHPYPVRPPPIWIGSWGSERGLRRVARLADGWLGSGYNTDPSTFRDAHARLRDLLTAEGKDHRTRRRSMGRHGRSGGQRVLRPDSALSGSAECSAQTRAAASCPDSIRRTSNLQVSSCRGRCGRGRICGRCRTQDVVRHRGRG